MITIGFTTMIFQHDKTVMTNAHLVFSEGVNQCPIDIVDGDAKSHDDHIFSHSRAGRVSISQAA